MSDTSQCQGRLCRECTERVPSDPRLVCRREGLPTLVGCHEDRVHSAQGSSTSPPTEATRDLFLSDDDREAFLARLAAVCERFELALLSYVLMGSRVSDTSQCAGAERPWIPLMESDLRAAFVGHATWRQHYRAQIALEDQPK